MRGVLGLMTAQIRFDFLTALKDGESQRLTPLGLRPESKDVARLPTGAN